MAIAERALTRDHLRRFERFAKSLLRQFDAYEHDDLFAGSTQEVEGAYVRTIEMRRRDMIITVEITGKRAD